MKNISLHIILSFSLLTACGIWDRDKDAGGTEGGGPEQTFTETGELRAVRNAAVVMPWSHYSYGRPQITFLEEEGTLVERGGVVAEIEKSGVLKVLENEKSNLDIAKADLNKMKVDQQMALEKLDAGYQSALSDLQEARIDTQRVRYESESRRQVARLELGRAEIALRKARDKIEATRLEHEQDLKIQMVKIEQIKSSIQQAERAIENYSLRATSRGMVVHDRNNRSHTKVQVGDQVHAGRAIVQLPDMSQMKALTAVNETDIRKIGLNQKVAVRLDAFPSLKFDGVITSISHTCHRKSRDSEIKVFDVEVLLAQNHRVLKPGMTVSCEFMLAQ